MATDGAWPSISEYGLQSTAALAERYEICEDMKTRLLSEHRSESQQIEHERFPRAIVRDQKPMSDRGLEKALGGSCSVPDWYKLLNSMVFFWLSKSRLKKMISARPYRDSHHDVLTIDTKLLVEAYEEKIKLSPMNSGNTKPYPHPRTPEIFMPIQSFPFEERKRTRPLENVVVELTIPHEVPDIEKYVVSVDRLNSADLA
jgi:hypothetical protein